MTQDIDRHDDTDDFRRWRETGDERLRDELVARYDWVATNAARRFRNRGEATEDLVQVGRIGLLKAVERFEPDHGSAFAAYATVTVLGEVRHHFRDASWHLAVPRRAKDIQTSLRGAIESLSHTLGRAPRPAEVAEHLGITEEAVIEGLDAGQAFRTRSLDQTNSASGGSGSGRRTARPHPHAEQGPDIGELAALKDLLDRLPDRERRIVELRFIEDLTQSEIAERLGISQMHVSRLLRSTLEGLRAAATT